MADGQNAIEEDRSAGQKRGAAAIPDRPTSRDLKPLRLLWPYVARRPGIFWPAILLLLGGVALTLALPIVARQIVDEGLANQNMTAINQGLAACFS